MSPNIMNPDEVIKNNEILLGVNQVEYSNGPEGPVIHLYGREPSGTARELIITGFKQSNSPKCRCLCRSPG